LAVAGAECQFLRRGDIDRGEPVPTYQYACTECGHAFEQFQSFSDDALTQCPECDGRLRKVFNAVGVVFKGSGFYRTDSRESSSAAPAAKSGGAGEKSSSSAEKSSSTASSTSSSSDSKPAATSSSSKPATD
jgi:putative FmdB family regulatory protein